MPVYKILPLDQTFASAEIDAPDAGAALDLSVELTFPEADVLEDERYLFSIRRMGPSGFWSIFQRDASEIASPIEGQESAS